MAQVLGNVGGRGWDQGERREENEEEMERGSIPLRRGSNLFSSTSRASVPSSMRSSLVMTPMVRWPMGTQADMLA